MGEMGALEDHLKSDKGCGYVIVECDNKNIAGKLCGKSLERRHLTNHKKNECKYRPYTCEYCGLKGTFVSITMGYNYALFFLSPHYDLCDQYPLECPNKCGETNIKRKDMEGHRDICPLEPLDCPFNAKDCCKNIRRKYMKTHKRMCDYRPYSCEYCGHRGTFMSITGKRSFLLFVRRKGGPSCHYDNCDQYPLKCPNKCGETKIKRKDMKRHCNICPLEPLDCPFKDVGCTDKIQRKDMKKHIESNTQHHLMMVCKSHHESIEANQELIKELMKANQELTIANQELMKANQELTKANEELKTRVEKLENSRK